MEAETPTREVAPLTTIKKVEVPANVKFRQILVTGPPASGKSTLVAELGGWPEEGFLDLAREWWRDRSLTLRPREVHLGFPVTGRSESLAVSDQEWVETSPALDLARIKIPPPKRGFLSVDWRSRFAFDVQLPPAKMLFDIHRARTAKGTHPRDASATLELVERQLAAYRAITHHLSRSGVRVYVRLEPGGRPREFADVAG